MRYFVGSPFFLKKKKKKNVSQKIYSPSCCPLVFLPVKLIYEMYTVHRHQCLFSTRERIFLGKCRSCWNKKCLEQGELNPQPSDSCRMLYHLSYRVPHISQSNVFRTLALTISIFSQRCTNNDIHFRLYVPEKVLEVFEEHISAQMGLGETNLLMNHVWTVLIVKKASADTIITNFRSCITVIGLVNHICPRCRA